MRHWNSPCSVSIAVQFRALPAVRRSVQVYRGAVLHSLAVMITATILFQSSTRRMASLRREWKKLCQLTGVLTSHHDGRLDVLKHHDYVSSARHGWLVFEFSRGEQRMHIEAASVSRPGHAMFHDRHRLESIACSLIHASNLVANPAANGGFQGTCGIRSPAITVSY